MLDPQSVQLIIAVVALVFFISVIAGLFYGLILLARIRSHTARINKRLDELLARSPAPSAGGNEPKQTL